ncbi:transcriptional regulator [Pseudomonas sp. FW306-02-F02-AA]|nr:transcriptional regulator [Pseudomonas sp. FW306-02-F02-AB]PMZ07438.1 transcriptional regulator [Pseudomonas sp. FW306-02-H06C]PMZ16640.1 transcriptional regulator [Pseudomonas sp. FW306-02-F02-AA]PMZ19042.1 transcriptional regulator [Pseudomonas sp. FW306-02-F08-AA]PMZ28001.1 transcriptional regulator [Pseudomonas sp. FW306-02-F04-BA]PMZ35021.1 transcriptional regulator [Pseudomonas sp. FW306-02-H06B]PMZ40725.1 transcriptional regulator [Pseudomonas sp. FW306-2-11AB]PMZ48048.1 transcript
MVVTKKMLIADRVGERLREERERLGLNQTEFGVLLGVSRGTQKNYELGANSLDLRYVAALEEHGADAAFILTGRRSTPFGQLFTAAEEELINQFRSISVDDQKAIRRFLKAMADDAAKGSN